jgi:hypothetical protein
VWPVSLENGLLFAGIVAEAAIIGLLLYRRVWRSFPVFCIYVTWGLISDAGNYAIQRNSAGLSSHAYLITYFTATVVDSVLQFGVLVELAWSVLRPIRSSLSRRALVLIGVVLVAAGAAIWPFAGIHGLAGYPAAWRNLVHVQQTTSILRIVFFLALAGCGQLLSIGWRDRELQIATGLGFYSLISLAVALLRNHQAMGPIYGALNQVVAASYVCSMVYWVFSFSQQEAERKEFTPQMQSFLMAVAGTAKSTRLAIAESATARSRDNRE